MENYINPKKSNEITSINYQKHNSYHKMKFKKKSYKEFEENNKIENQESKNKTIISLFNKKNLNYDENDRPSSFTKIKQDFFLTKSPKKKVLNSPQIKLKRNRLEDNEDSDIIILKRKTNYITKKKNKNLEFSFLEQPELYDNSNTHIQLKKKKNHFHFNGNDEDNISLFSLTGLTNHSIIKLNDIQKDFKKTIIGNTKIKQFNKGKSYFMEDYLEEKKNETDSLIEEEDEEKNDFDKENYRMLQKVGKIFDSLDEEDITINDFYIDPENKIIIILDILIAIFTIYNLIYIPFFLGYNDIYCRKGKFLGFLEIIDIFNDIILIIDNIISFFLAFRVNEELKTELKEIRNNYLKKFFLIDFLAAIPFKTIFSIFDKKCNDKGYLSAPLYQNNIYYILITLQLPKSIKVFRRNYLIKYLKDYLNQYEHFNIYLGLYESIAIFLIGIHIVSCIFIFIGKNQYPGWIVHYEFEDKHFLSLYFIAIYYIITTVTTVGYGDLLCITPIEKLFGLFMEIVGIFAYSFALTSISNYVKVLSDKNEEYHQKCEILEDIRVTYPDLSDDLYNRIHCFLKNNLFHNKKDKKIIINSLPAALKNNLVYHMYDNIIKNFIFFKNFNNADFIVRVILSFKPILAIKNDILIKDGDFVDDMIFIKFGRLCLDLPIVFEREVMKPTLKETNSVTEDIKNSVLENFMVEEEEEEEKMFEETVQYFKILELQKNEHFGDILMFLNKRSSLRLIVKSRKAELFYLNKINALEISTSYPLIWKKINKKSLFNWEQIKRLMNKVYKIFNKYHHNHDEINEEEQPNLTTSIIEYTDLQSIPSSSLMSDEDDNQLKKQILKENTQKNKEITTIKSLNTIKESKTFEDKSEHSCVNNNNNNTNNNNNNNTNNNNNNNNTNITNNNNNHHYFNHINNNNINNKKRDSEFSENKLNKSVVTEKSLVTKRISVKGNDDESEEEESECESEIENENKLKDRVYNLNNDMNKKKKLNLYEKTSEGNNQSYFFPSGKSNITPYKPNEINNEIYPYETFIVTENNNINNNNLNTNLQSLLKSKLNSNYSENNNSICSTEISFSIESEYENINEMSNYKYSKNEILKKKIKSILTEISNFEGTVKSNLKKKKKTVIHINKTPSVKFLGHDKKNYQTLNSINNSSIISNKSKLKEGSFVSKKNKSYISFVSSVSNNSRDFKKRKKKKFT